MSFVFFFFLFFPSRRKRKKKTKTNKTISQKKKKKKKKKNRTGNRTVLQAHAAFFDADKDGVLSLSDTYKGMRSTGFGRVLAAVGTLVIHGSFSFPTSPPVEVRLPAFLGGRNRRDPLFSLRLPDPFLRVFISNVHKGKHGSDSGTYVFCFSFLFFLLSSSFSSSISTTTTIFSPPPLLHKRKRSYDTEGRFVPERLEECFSKYAGKGDGSFASSSTSRTPAAAAKKKAAAAAAASLTLDETKGKGKAATAAGSVVDVGARDSLTWADIRCMLKGNRLLFDPFGATAAFLEWGGLFWVAAQRRASDGRFVITRERARAAADGTLFSLLRADRERAAAKAKATTTGGTKKKTAEGGGGGGSGSGSIPAGRRSPPPPATQVDLAPHPPAAAATATAKKAQ